MFHWLDTHLLPCGFKSIFGIDCPACGAQRSLLLLLRGQPGESFLTYPPLVFVLLLAALAMLRVSRRDMVRAASLKKYSIVVLCVVMINYVINFFI